MTTKEKLIAAALELFAEHGYAGTSTRDICKKADVNSASIGYHFGDKRSLYQAVLESELGANRALSQILDEDLPAAERLRMIVGSNLQDVFDTRSGPRGKLALREIANPSPELVEVLRRKMDSQFSKFLDCLAELAPSADRETLIRCALSVVGQIQYYRTFYRFLPHMLGKEKCESLSVEALTDHITQFTLGALDSLAQEG